MASKQKLVCLTTSVLAALTYAAPLITNNVTDMIIDSEARTDLDLLHTLHSRSPMNPAAGPSTGQSSSGAAVAAAAAAAAGRAAGPPPVPGISNDELRSYAKKGHEYYMPLIFADDEHTGEMLNTEFEITSDPAYWHRNRQFDKLIDNGWTEYDLSPQLAGSQFMRKFAGTFGRMTVGQAEETMVPKGQPHLRHPSMQVWLQGPNRKIRMTQNQQWRSGLSSLAKSAAPPTNAYHEAIYNVRDGIIILLAQSPAADLLIMPATRKYGKFDHAQFHQVWGTDQIWFDSWLRQHDTHTPNVLKTYENMPPALKKSQMATVNKISDLRFIFVPDIGTRNERLEQHVLGVIHRCLSSVKRGTAIPRYSEFGSFCPAGSWCTNALLSTPTNSYIANLLARHKNGHNKSLRHKTIVGVHIIRLDDQTDASRADPSLMWEIADYKHSDVLCADAWGKIAPGQPLPVRFNAGNAATRSEKGKAPVIIPLECYSEMMKEWQPEDSDVEMSDAGQDSEDRSSNPDFEPSSSEAQSSDRMSVDSETQRAAQNLFNIDANIGTARLSPGRQLGQGSSAQPRPAPERQPGQGPSDQPKFSGKGKGPARDPD